MKLSRRKFLSASVSFGLVGTTFGAVAESTADVLDLWQTETDAVDASMYAEYMWGIGETCGLVSLEKLERTFDKIRKEVTETAVTDRPAVWLVYNMGFIVKTAKSVFAIDLIHRRAGEFAEMLDFSLVTHNHRDHFHPELYQKMNLSGKTVISNFLDNYKAKNFKINGGYTRGRKVFKIRDVEIATSLIDHNGYLLDFTTAFEIRVGDWKLLHTGDCSSVGKLKLRWGSPDVWLVFPGCGLNIAEAEKKIRPVRMVFGHLWELGHANGRLTTPMVKNARVKAASVGANVSIPLWGDRIC